MACEPCEPGTINAKRGASRCTQCPGFAVSRPAALKCDSCPSNSTANYNRTECLCNTRYFKKDVGIPRYANFTCEMCKPGASCDTQAMSLDSLEAQPGFIKKLNSKDEFIACVEPRVCLGNGLCAEGHSGLMCSVCDEGWGRFTQFSCAKCPDMFLNVLFIAVVLVALFLATTAQTFFSFTNAGQKPSAQAVVLKIFWSGVSLNAMVLWLNVEWPQEFTDLVKWQGDSASSGMNLISLDCLLRVLSPENAFFSKSILALLIPLLCIGLPALATIPFYCYRMGRGGFRRKDRSAVKGALTQLTSIVMFVLHAMLVAQALSMFICMEMGAKTTDMYLANDLQHQCWADSHLQWLGLGICLVALYVVGIPLFTGLLLYRNRRAMVLDIPPETADSSNEQYNAHRQNVLNQVRKVERRLGFVFSGYTHRFIWWELVIYLKKTAMITVVFLVNKDVFLQCNLSLLVTTMGVAAHLAAWPYIWLPINLLELFSTAVSFTTFYVGSLMLVCSFSSVSVPPLCCTCHPTFPPFHPSHTHNLLQGNLTDNQKALASLTVVVVNFAFCGVCVLTVFFLAVSDSDLTLNRIQLVCRATFPHIFLPLPLHAPSHNNRRGSQLARITASTRSVKVRLLRMAQVSYRVKLSMFFDNRTLFMLVRHHNPLQIDSAGFSDRTWDFCRRS